MTTPNLAEEELTAPMPVPFWEGLHRTPPESMVAPAEFKAPEIGEAAAVNWWVNKEFRFYYSVPSGINQYTWAAQLSVNASLEFDFYGFSAQTYGGTACERSVLDHIVGRFGVHTTPQYWIDLPGKGEEYWKDSCNPAIDQTVPVNIDYRWLVSPVDKGLTRLLFENSKYKWPFNKFIMRRIK